MTPFEPSVDPDQGGTSLGNSYLSLWARCPRKWYYEYYRATDVGRGLAPLNESPDLMLGSLFHEGLAEWYTSGFDSGEDTGGYDLDAGLEGIALYRDQQEEDCDELAEQAGQMLTTYHETYGPGAPLQDYPNLRIAADAEGQPLVERDFRFELAPGKWYTGRIDAICIHDNQLKVLEHKTAGVRSVGGRLRSIGTDSQFAGEQWLLQQALPDLAVSGVLVNCVLKDWGGPKTKSGALSKFQAIAVRETTIRTSAQIEQWRLDAVAILDEIERATKLFEWRLERSWPLEWAEAECFPVRGTRNGHCHAYNRDCEFLDFCHAPGFHERVLPMFRKKET